MINDILNEADSKMDKSVEAAREEFAAIRAGRAQPSMFSKILVDYYGAPTPLQQLASFTAPGPCLPCRNYKRTMPDCRQDTTGGGTMQSGSR